DDGGPAWADAGVICPWTMYLCYGDKALLARHYESYTRFIGHLEKYAKDHIRSHPDSKVWHGYGDWLALDGSGNVFGNTPKDLIGTAMFAYSASIVAKMARVLGKVDDAARYERLTERVRRAYQQRYLTGDGVATGLTQTSYVLTLAFDLAPEKLRPKLLHELVRDIEARGNKLTTGFVGASYLPLVLTRLGRTDLAYKLLHQKTWPSWLYAVTQGATTIWERWDGWTQEKGFQDKGMNSFNHYAYGAIGTWLYTVVAGIDLDPAAPAYKRILLTPRPGGEITSARGELHSVHGPILSQWKLRPGRFEWEVVVPPNTTATATFPVPAGARITEGRKPLAQSAGVSGVRGSRCTLAAGHYKFTADWKA
ncbi:MAG TPA: alpha-L-rhamnosidase C-terminal domain-containing protein, partial [Opitutaceae bacterium]|nr:alpha-L-rhamnosidase C-terminal domain-containing protein [Opitutaceae bacterium]